jgi:two-component system OmpR family sensor kinase
MGRLFWKFFLMVWLAQATAVFVTSAYFWHERPPHPHAPPGSRPPPPEGLPQRDHKPHGPPPPLLHLLTGLLASLLSAAGIAWYVVRPVRRLQSAFTESSRGNLAVRIGPSMGTRRDELADLAHDFDRMNAQLAHLMDAQRRLLHDVSHELRSPLARMHAAIGLARQSPERMQETMARLEREGTRMDHLVGELLTLSRLEAGPTTETDWVDLDELLHELVCDARFEASQRAVEIALHTQPGSEVFGNPALLHRALENVLRNALRHAPQGSTVTIQVSSVMPAHLRIAILDCGPGVPTALLTAIFEPFRRHGEHSGYGLGLTIAQRIIEGAAGHIHAENRPEGGLAVLIELPSRSGSQHTAGGPEMGGDQRTEGPTIR